MHGIRLKKEAPKSAASALPLLCLNSITMLGAEIYGRSYGGGVLKMEPREAAVLPVPGVPALNAAFAVLKNDRAGLERQLREGHWTTVVKRVDQVLLRDVFGLSSGEALSMYEAAIALRSRRMRKTSVGSS